MVTRSITVIKDATGSKIIEMYKQSDEFGAELQEFINSGIMVDGIGLNAKHKFNSIACFAAQLVAHFKDGPGGIYLHSPTSNYKNKKKYWDKYRAEYYYEIDSDLKLRCWDCYKNKKIDLKEYNAKD